jgi:sialate O-acetylesterase
MRKLTILLALLVLLEMTSGVAWALSLPRVFSDNMVLQRDAKVQVWGWAQPGQAVHVGFGGQIKKAVAGADGKWRVVLDPMPAKAEASDLDVVAGIDRISVHNVLVGEVWICSGQSNMELPLEKALNGKEAIETAQFPLIRQFGIPHALNIKPQDDLNGGWLVCSPQTAQYFSAVGYHFALQLHDDLKVPIALIHSSWGGTRIEPWTDPQGFAVSPMLKDIYDLVANVDQVHLRNQAAYLDQVDAWVKQGRSFLQAGQELTNAPPKLPDHPLGTVSSPTAIYNAMIAPLVPYTIRGAIWYQGESNNGDGMLYYEKMKALISSWRRIWGQGDFPFFFVQLAPFQYKSPEALPEMWEAQTAALSIPNTGMAVITDIGTIRDIHPRNKEEVGRRLSLWARAKVYGETNLEYSGPLYKSMQIKGGDVIIAFDHAQGLKTRDGKALNWFSIAGPDKQFVWALADIVGQTVVVRNQSVPDPVAVRFGWDEIAQPNLCNGAGLPASPFRTDTGGRAEAAGSGK